MVIVMRSGCTAKELGEVLKKVQQLGLEPHICRGEHYTVVGVIGNGTRKMIENTKFISLAGVERVVPVLKPYKLVSRDFKPENTIVKVGNLEIGGPQIQLIAGPCAVEGKEMILETAITLRSAGICFLRGGAFKPRTSPYSFQGLGQKALEYLSLAREKTGMKIVTELLDTRDVDLVYSCANIIQIGARNMQNFELLKVVGHLDKPILLKRGLGATIKEFLMAAEYIVSCGNEDVILCERGIRTFETETRNTLDISAVPLLKQLTHLPVIIDPSHAAGRKDIILPLARAAVAVGADGLMVEVHPCPQKAKSDGAQSLTPNEFFSLIKEVQAIASVVGRQVWLRKNRKVYSQIEAMYPKLNSQQEVVWQ